MAPPNLPWRSAVTALWNWWAPSLIAFLGAVPVGVFSLTRQQVRLFTDKQIELVTTFADQAVIAIENVRLFDEVQARTEELSASLRQQTATAEVLKTISRTAFDLQRVFDTLVENAVRLCEAERAFLFRFDGEFLRSVASYNVSPELRDFIDRNPIAPGRHSISARAALERRTVHVSDVQADPEYAYAVRDERPIRSTLAVPMLKGDALVGTITIYRLELKPFTDKQIALVETFADQAVIAIENVRLFDEIQDKSRQLAVASENKSQFVSSVSHELRTPLNAIIGLTEMMVTNAARFGTEKAPEPLQRVNRAGTHLLGLINQVLDLSKIEAGKLELNPQTVQLAPLIDEVVGTARQLAEQNKNRLIVEVPDDLGTLTVDPMRLRQILLNLLSNACKFTKEGEVKLQGAKGERRPRLDRAGRRRQRHRHDAGAAGEAVRGVHPSRRHDRAAFRRHRPRSCDHPQARSHDGRRCDSGKRAGQRLGVHGTPASGRGYPS